MPTNPRNIAIADYDYPLPDERIAKFPLAERDRSKLLVYRDGTINESQFFHLPELLPEGAMLLFNNTKVIHARLFFRKPTGSVIEIFCLEPYQQPVTEAFEERQRCTWLCFIGNNKKWKEGPLFSEFEIQNSKFKIAASRREAKGNAWIVDFEWTGGISFAEVIEYAGVIPLPPYLNRDAEESDKERYQTVYAHYEGSVAAPTAGLHFTDRLLKELNNKGINIAIASNKYQEGVDAVVEFYFQDIKFAATVGTSTEIPVKPNPTIVHKIIEKCPVAKKEILYLGDSGVDMKTAKNAGLTALGVLWGFRTKDELIANGADYTIEKVEEIWNFI